MLRLSFASSRAVEQRPRSVVGGPRSGCQEVAQASGGFGEVAVAVDGLDLAGVLPVGRLTLPVQLQAGRICDPELGGNVLSNLRGNFGRVSEECTQEPHRPQLNPEAKAVGVSPRSALLALGRHRSGRRTAPAPLGWEIPQIAHR